MSTPVWKSQRIWVLIASIILILGLAGLSLGSGVDVDSDWIVTVVGAVAAAFLISRGLTGP